MNHDGKGRADLVRQANQARAKLLHTVEQLDQRRQEALDLRLQVQRHLTGLAVLAAAVIVLTGGAVALLVHRISTAAERRRRARWKLARDVWRHPDRVRRSERRSFFGELLRGALLSVATALVALPGRRLVAALSEPRKQPAP